MRRKTAGRFFAATLFGGAGVSIAASWVAGRALSKPPISASPGRAAAGRPTLLFLHGKGGNAAEWRPEALRALACGYNVLLPDLRGHGQSGGRFVTHGFLEKEDLANAIACARDRHGIDSGRLGVHGCSAGPALAIEFAADRYGVRALWLESPYADAKAMARHYLSRATGLPPWLLGLTSHFPVGGAGAPLGPGPFPRAAARG